MAYQILHKAATRGHSQHGWLESWHTFSFAHYHDPQRMHFGVLRVLNDDTVEAGRGFGSHPHENMEIITIPLEGELEHADNMGHRQVIRPGDIQVMSAGTGIVHSEFARPGEGPVRFLQVWLFPDRRNVAPRYDQLTLEPERSLNRFQQMLSPDPHDDGVWVHQQAWFHLGRFQAGREAGYMVKRAGNGVYAFVIEGSATINGQALERRDGLGLWEVDVLHVEAGAAGAHVLLMDVPMRAS